MSQSGAVEAVDDFDLPFDDRTDDIDCSDGEWGDNTFWTLIDAHRAAESGAAATDLAVRPIGLLTTAQVLEQLDSTGRELARITARRHQALAELQQRGASEETLGVDAAGWMVLQNTHSPRRAKAEARMATKVTSEAVIVDALRDGRLSVEQAERIAHGLDRLPDEMSAGRRSEVAAQLVGFAADFGPDALSRLVNRAVEVVAPEVAEAADLAALERLEREQHRDRFVSLKQDPDGAWLLAGRFGKVDGAKLATQLAAEATRIRSHSDDELQWGQAMADALVSVFAHHASSGEAAMHGADRPRVTVVVALETLKGELASAHLLDSDVDITATEARRLACDADILPAVMGTDSVPLDVGREKRLFTGPLRQAALTRDKGCVFPGCDRPPSACEVHHIVPWWAGGETKLDNAATLCEYHHHVVEPDPSKPADVQWELSLDHRGLPTFLAPANPRHPERERLRRQHHRFRL